MTHEVNDLFDHILERREMNEGIDYSHGETWSMLHAFWDVVFLAYETGKLNDLINELRELKEEQNKNGE